MNISCTRRHINDQVVQLIPIHIADELFDCGARHRPTPHHCVALIYQKTERDQLYSKPLERYNLSLLSICGIRLHHHRSLTSHTEHDRHTRSVNISIKQSHLRSTLRNCKSQVRSNG